MKQIIIVTVVFFSIVANAKSHKVEISSNGLGFDNSASKVDNSDSVNDFEESSTVFKINYAYKLLSHFWIEGKLGLSNYSKKLLDSGTKTEENRKNLYLGGIFDLSNTAINAWTVSFGFGINELKNKDGDRVLSLEGYRLAIGKRFSLDFMNISNISIEPQLIAEFGNIFSDTVDDAYNGYEIQYYPSVVFQLFF